MDSYNKLKVVDIKSVDKSTVYIAVDSLSWRTHAKISLDDIVKNIEYDKSAYLNSVDNDTIIIDPSSLKISLNKKYAPDVFYEPFLSQNINIHLTPKNASEFTGMHLSADENYLYVWVSSQNRWKRIPLSEW